MQVLSLRGCARVRIDFSLSAHSPGDTFVMPTQSASPVSGVVTRLLTTVLLLVVVYAAGYVLLPGLDAERVGQLTKQAMGSANMDVRALSIVALGLRPLMTGFLVVELAAVLVPSWRRQRFDTKGRSRLRIISLGISFLFAVVQGYFMCRYLQSAGQSNPQLQLVTSPDSAEWVLLASLTLGGGIAVLWVIAGLIDRFGLGSGVAWLMALDVIMELGTHFRSWFVASPGDLLSPATFLQESLLIACSAAATFLVLRTPLRRIDGSASSTLHLPITSLYPLSGASSLAMLVMPILLSELGHSAEFATQRWTRDNPLYLAAYYLILLALGVTCAWGFSRPERSWQPDAVIRRRAGLASVFYLLVMATVPVVGQHWLSLDMSNPVGIAMLVALAIDLRAEASLRLQQAQVVSLGIFPNVHSAAMACEQLREKGIACCVRNLHQRSLWRFLGPAYELHLLVSEEHSKRARSILDTDVQDEPSQTGRAANPNASVDSST